MAPSQTSAELEAAAVVAAAAAPSLGSSSSYTGAVTGTVEVAFEKGRSGRMGVEEEVIWMM